MKIYFRLQERKETVWNNEPWMRFTFTPQTNVVEDRASALTLKEGNPSKFVLHIPLVELHNSTLEDSFAGDIVSLEVSESIWAADGKLI